MKVKLVGYTQPAEEFKEHFSDLKELVVFCARVSNPSNQYNNDTADKLVNYLTRNAHWSPLEMCSATLEIETTRDIARQFLRHRSFCLGGDSQIWFDLPGAEDKGFKTYRKSIAYLWDRWHNGAEELPTGQRIPMRDRIAAMHIRCMNEITGEIIHTHINDITKDRAHLYKVSFSNGDSVVSSMDHKYFTSNGWMTLKEAIDAGVKFVAQAQKSIKEVEQHFPEVNEQDEEWRPVKNWENYLVSNMGRVKRIGEYSSGVVRQGSVGNHGYPRVSFNRPGVQEEDTMHRLVMKTFNPIENQDEMFVCHKNHNKLDCRLENLEWGTDAENKIATRLEDMHSRLRTNFVDLVGVESLGEQDCYDISVIGPFHNFICDGVVVHNSFQEFSQRYANPTEDLGFTIREARLQDTKNRQNSIDLNLSWPDERELNNLWIEKQQAVIAAAKDAYVWAVTNGIAKEQARVVLPEGNTESRLYVAGTIRSWIHYISVRTDASTQKEHRELALEIARVINKIFPVVIEDKN